MASAQDHMTYIHEKVNPILEALVTAVLLERPDDPVGFMIKWLSEQSADKATSSHEVEKLQKEIERLKLKQQELLKDLNVTTEAKDAAAAPASGAPAGSAAEAPAAPTDAQGKAEPAEEEDEDEDEEADDDDDVDDDMPPPSSYNKGPRWSVSAEAYGDWNKSKTDFTAPVYDKSVEQAERISNKLVSSFLFSGLEKTGKSIVVSAMKITEVEVDEKIINQGDDGECLYVIDSGVVECYKTIKGEEKFLCSLSSGDAFGELALLYNCPRAASVICREKAVLFELDRETFNHIVKDSASKKRERHEGFLKSVDILKNLETYEIMLIADALKETNFAKGDYIIRQGDPGNEFYMVEDGHVHVTKTQSDGSEHKVKEYGVADYFGELALLKNEPRAASVIAQTDVKVVSLDRRTFKRLLGPLSDIIQRDYSQGS
eukprot:GEMP01024477.1.p1 GENE.GEMP01024477.1~~GEMP01024477.1.p1  ORF type:complete len:431 (+),score=99.77 GEMP01024477.1:150-1442(+)